MTKAALKEKYREWNIAISKQEDRQKEIWEELQQLRFEHGDGHKWCSMDKLVEELMKAGKTTKTMQLVSEYYTIEGQKEALRNLAIATHNFEI